MYLIWLAIIIILTIIELSTITLVSIWFVISALFALIVSFFTDSFLIQFAVFVLGGLLLLLSTRKLVKNVLKPKNVKTNSDKLIGMIGVVTEEIKRNESGEVKVDGKKWTAISNKKIEVGSEVKILEIDGVKLKVERSDEK